MQVIKIHFRGSFIIRSDSVRQQIFYLQNDSYLVRFGKHVNFNPQTNCFDMLIRGRINI